MPSKLCCSIVLLCVINFCKAQNSTIVLDTSMLDRDWRSIGLTGLDGWIYKAGNDTSAAKKDIDTIGWIKFKPSELTVKNADKNGRVQGWFRMRFKLDSSFENFPLTIAALQWAATDVYIDGRHIASYGNTGLNGKPYEEFRDNLTPPVSLDLQPDSVHVLSLHLVDYASPFKPSLLKTQAAGTNVTAIINLGEANKGYVRANQILKQMSIYFTLFTAVCSVLSILFWLLYFQNRSEKVLLFISLGITFFSLDMLCITLYACQTGISFFLYESLNYLAFFLGPLASAIMVLSVAKAFGRKISPLFLLAAFLYPIIVTISAYYSLTILGTAMIILLILVPLYLIISSWKKLKGAQWAVVAGVIITFISVGLWSFQLSKYNDWPFPFAYLMMAGIFLSVPLSLMVYVAWRFKEVLIEVQKNAAQVLQMSEEKKEQALKQQKILEVEVAAQTIELRTAFNNLKSTQAQLIQSEKMASLGEVTAGIAHEIQNPLNFVNNFSELSKELLEEMKTEMVNGNSNDAKEIADDVIQNLEKINHHGKRADAIVKGMLQHSRSGTGVKEPTDINKLADEYLRLAYHGLKAKDRDFNAEIRSDFDNTIGKINIIPRDIGRVLLNLYNNSFYAVSEKKKQQPENYEPTVSITTKKINGKVEIRVSDNGNGIPHKVVDKIFQPFFTTKPTGQGTGLGLSLSYDIVKAHGGEIKVNTKEGEFTEFVLQLPISV